jgi:hypothetical protein
MPRGNFWEATFDPLWDGPVKLSYLTEMAGASGFIRRRIVPTNEQTTSVKWKRSDNTPRRFQECDFQLAVQDAYISDCTFVRCRFKDSTWTDVKFRFFVEFRGIVTGRP